MGPIVKVIAFHTAEKYNLVPLKVYLTSISLGFHPKIYQLDKKQKDVSFLYFNVTETSAAQKGQAPSFLSWSDQDKDYFIFEDGVVVGWGISESDQQSLQQILTNYSQNLLTDITNGHVVQL